MTWGRGPRLNAAARLGDGHKPVKMQSEATMKEVCL